MSCYISQETKGHCTHDDDEDGQSDFETYSHDQNVLPIPS